MYLSVDSESRLLFVFPLLFDYVFSLVKFPSPVLSAYEAAASEVISFYAARLQDTVGEGFQVATLAFYAEYWLHSSGESFHFLPSASRVVLTLHLLMPYFSRDPTSSSSSLWIRTRPNTRRGDPGRR